MKSRIYVGHKSEGSNEVFRSETEPTLESHGHLYGYVIGPFHTMQGARWMRDYGFNNPNLTTAGDCERIARLEVD